ncbi:MAG: alpha/beta hydrolase [Lachnospiraceae bacterium]|nr:alpha/beta hydrolase [Lachnospiraceae bacterium]
MFEKYKEWKKERGEVSLQGRSVRRAVEIVNHLPGIGHMSQNGELRKKLDELSKPWEAPEGLTLEVVDLSESRLEILYDEINDDKRVILQLHGGGYYGGLHNTYRDMAALYHQLAVKTAVVTLDYRLAPENPFPAALLDASEAYEWLLDQGIEAENIVVVGDSAGGGLSLALILYLKDHNRPLPAGVLTMSAWTDLTLSGESYEENYNDDPVFGGSRDTLVYKTGYVGENDPKNPYISPLYGDYTGFCPMLMQVGEQEMLLSDTLAVSKKAKAAGVKVREHTYKGMFHDFQMGLLRYPESRKAWEEAAAFLRKVLPVKKEQD